MNQSLPSQRLSFELLEDRLTPAFGTPWYDGTSLTLSFVPDGTDISGETSNLSELLGSALTQSQWKREILRAYQSWSARANLNVGLVADGGQAMGISGAPQADIRFGDIRIGARPLSAPGTDYSTMAGAAGFDYNSKTWAGDLVFNSQYQFGIGGTLGQQSDLFTVALHEAGHSFGFADSHSDSTSVMWARYEGVRTDLAEQDITALQDLYGVRVDDQFEGQSGNGTLATAYNLTTNGNLLAVSGDITRLTDVDYYSFTTPDALSGVGGLTVDLQASGISLLTSRVTVFDSQGQMVASAQSTDPLANNLSFAIPNYQVSSTYVVKVEGSGSDVFSIGAYVLKLNYSSSASTGSGSLDPSAMVTTAYFTNTELTISNTTLTAAATLTPVSTSSLANTFTLTGAIDSSTDVDWFTITPSASMQFTGTLFVGAIMATDGLRPEVSVYNTAGELLSSVVTMNEDGAYQVQLASAVAGTTYHIRVSAADSTSLRSTGTYALGATLAPVGTTQFDDVVSDTLSAAESVQYSKMEVAGDRLTQFALTATGGSTSATTAVRMSVFDSAGHLVFTTVAVAGQSLSTAAVWLPSGDYTVAFNAATQDGSNIESLGLAVEARTLSDPIDPYVENPTSPPAPQSPISIAAPTTDQPVGPILDPITNPFLGLFGFWS